jgi:hypothetical protein
MKKIIYSVLVALTLSFAFSSCTEEEVAPDNTLKNGGGTGITEKL